MELINMVDELKELFHEVSYMVEDLAEAALSVSKIPKPILTESENHRLIKDSTLTAARMIKLFEDEVSIAKKIFNNLNENVLDIEGKKYKKYFSDRGSTFSSKEKANLIRIPAFTKHESQPRIVAATKESSKQRSDTNINQVADTKEYCVCRGSGMGEMIGCDGANCAIGWFHQKCVGVKKPFPELWYCSDCAKSQSRVKKEKNGVKNSTSCSKEFDEVSREVLLNQEDSRNNTDLQNKNKVSGKRRRKIPSSGNEIFTNRYDSSLRTKRVRGSEVEESKYDVLPHPRENEPLTKADQKNNMSEMMVAETDRKIASV